MSHRDSMLYKIYLGVSINTWSGSFGLKRYQAQALGIADRNVGKVSGRAEFYQRLKALSVAPVKEPTKGQAIIVGVPKYLQTGGAGSSRIGAIKALRELTSLGLKEAKDVIDCVDGNCGQSQNNYHFPTTDIETANRQPERTHAEVLARFDVTTLDIESTGTDPYEDQASAQAYQKENDSLWQRYIARRTRSRVVKGL